MKKVQPSTEMILDSKNINLNCYIFTKWLDTKQHSCLSRSENYAFWYYFLHQIDLEKSYAPSCGYG